MLVLTSVAHLLSASPSSAQGSAAISLLNDYRLRGYSLSEGHPAASLDLSYDAPSGLYGAVSGSVFSAHNEGLKPLGFIMNAGYAKQLGPETDLDLGISHSSYSRYSSRAAALSYTEVYVGVSGELLSARLSLSPDYVKGGSAYAELNGSWAIATKLNLIAHGGLILPFAGSPSRYTQRRDVDWRLGVTRQFGHVSLLAAWSGVQPGRGAYRDHTHNRDGIILSVTYAL